jgi:hypothetical protein
MRTASKLAAVGAALTLACGRAPDRAAQSAPPQAPDVPALDAGRFVRPSAIDNPWMPLTPGTRLVYEGTAV